MPLPPTGRPTRATWRMARVNAPRPLRGSSGLMPHTIGPLTAPEPASASSWKNDRRTSAALRRLHRRIVGTPASRWRIATRLRVRTLGGSVAAARISLATGTAARRYRRYPSTSSGCVLRSESSVRSTSWYCVHGAPPARFRTMRCGAAMAPCRGTAGRRTPRSSSDITGVVRNVRWSQLHTLTVTPANPRSLPFRRRLGGPRATTCACHPWRDRRP